MKLLNRLILLLLLCCLATPAQSQEPVPLAAAEQQKVLTRIQGVQEGIATLSADFTETRHLRDLAAPITFSGTLHVSRDGLLFMQYSRPLKHILHVQGNEATFFMPAGKSADIVDLAKLNGQAMRPDFFNLRVDQFKGTILSTADVYILQDPNPTGPKVRVELDRETLLARRIIMVGEAGDRTEISLQQVVVNKGLPAEVKQFSLPASTKINRVGQ